MNENEEKKIVDAEEAAMVTVASEPPAELGAANETIYS